jgi:hypothetical protein
VTRERREQGIGPTNDPRRQALQRRAEEDAMRRYKRDTRKLLRLPEFRRWLAQLVYGELRLKAKGAWKRDSEIHREAARRDVAAELLVNLAAIDARGVLSVEQEHLNRLAEEAEAAGRLQENLDESEDA